MDTYTLQGHMTQGNANDGQEEEMSRITEEGMFLKLEPETPNADGLKALIGQFKTNHVVRLQILHTALISWTSAAAAWRLAMIGPTFPDLMQIIDVDISVGSWLLTAFYIGNIVGSLLGGFLYDRYSKIFVITSAMVLLTCGTAIIPWCTTFATMVIGQVIGGISYGAIDVLTMTDILHVWKSRSVYMLQFNQFCYSIGAIISPLASGPFLSKKISGKALSTVLNISTASTSNISAIPLLNVSPFIILTSSPLSILTTMSTLNVSTEYIPDGSALLDVSLNTSMSGDIENTLLYGETRIHIAYMISAAISLLNIIGFIFYYVIYGDVYAVFADFTHDSKANGIKTTKHRSEFSTRIKLFFLCCLASLVMLHMLTERTFTGYLLSYLTTQKGWDKTIGSMSNSVYWIAAAISRLIATPFFSCIQLTRAMFICLAVTVMGVVVFLVTLYVDSEALVWIVVLLLGFGIAPLFSGWFTWLSENVVPASGKTTSIMYMTGVAANSLFPPLLGYLFKYYTYDWLVYVLLILVPGLCVVFSCVVTIHGRLARKQMKG